MAIRSVKLVLALDPKYPKTLGGPEPGSLGADCDSTGSAY